MSQKAIIVFLEAVIVIEQRKQEVRIEGYINRAFV